MYIIKGKNVDNIWYESCFLVNTKGHSIKDGDKNLKEILDLFIEVDNASQQCEIIEKYGDQKMINWMISENFEGNKPVLNWNYCYGMRFNNFNGVNQIEKIIEKLKSNPESKSATITLMDPSNDFNDHVPCIMVIDFKNRAGCLNMTAFFRSQDVGKKMYADILALGNIQERVMNQVGLERGVLKVLISSAHIYEEDFEKINKMIKDIQNWNL